MKLVLKLFIGLVVTIFIAVSSYAAYSSVTHKITIVESAEGLAINLGLHILGMVVSIQDLFEKEIDIYRGINTPNNYEYENDFFIYDTNDVSQSIGKRDPKAFFSTLHTIGGTNYDLLIEHGDNVDCYSRVGYEVPQSGTVTAIFSRYKRLTWSQDDVDKFLKIVNTDSEETYHILTEQWWHDSEGFYFAYNGCRVAKQSPGYIVYADDKWLFVTDEDYREYSNSVEKPNTYDGIGTTITDAKTIQMLKSDRMRWLRPASAQKMMDDQQAEISAILRN